MTVVASGDEQAGARIELTVFSNPVVAERLADTMRPALGNRAEFLADRPDRSNGRGYYSALVASGIRCKSDGRGSGFMVKLCGGTDILRGADVLAGLRHFAGNQDHLEAGAGQAVRV